MNPIYTLVFLFTFEGEIQEMKTIDENISREACQAQLQDYVNSADPGVRFEPYEDSMSFGVVATHEDAPGAKIHGMCVSLEEDI